MDGDGGDENLKDYPIEENSELTIRSVVNNRMLYQEGWGVESIKHSLTYSGGFSRGCVRGYACAREYGFEGFSPYTRPSVIAVAEAIPFAELTQGSHERLYALKGEIVARGIRSVLGLEMPIFPKRRFQHGSVSAERGRATVPAGRGDATGATSRRCTPPRCERVGRRPADPQSPSAEAARRSVRGARLGGRGGAPARRDGSSAR